MRRLIIVVVVVLLLVAALAVNVSAQDGDCWGQASATFAQAGEMGGHASQGETPRLGLHNLAVELSDEGVIEDSSIQALGAFVAAEKGYSIEACSG